MVHYKPFKVYININNFYIHNAYSNQYIGIVKFIKKKIKNKNKKKKKNYYYRLIFIFFFFFNNNIFIYDHSI